MKGRVMQIGIMLEGQMGLNWENWKNVLQTAEDTGYQCVFRSDHFSNPTGPFQDSLELFASLVYAASHTKRIEFGPMVTPITFRHPAVIANSGAAIDVLSNGRFYLGMGIGWQDREHKAFDIYFPESKERYERLTDALEIVTRLYKSDEPVSYEGKHFSLNDAQITMKRDTKILIGGNGIQKTMRLAAKYAQEWNGVFLSREDYKERNRILDGYLAEEGRQPSDVKRSLMIRVLYGKTDADVKKRMGESKFSKEELISRGIVVGTGSEIVEQLGAWEEAGCQRIMLQWLELDDMLGLENMAADILPVFHK
jgi:alkanesulfonate monooxygenase SsuD/methylene tetrahydromethanopterin reductase-like flavin-dependent oxidoreductase (luciferase family)